MVGNSVSLERVEIRNFRCFTDYSPLIVPLNAAVVAFVGPNIVGKTAALIQIVLEPSRSQKPGNLSQGDQRQLDIEISSTRLHIRVVQSERCCAAGVIRALRSIQPDRPVSQTVIPDRS